MSGTVKLTEMIARLTRERDEARVEARTLRNAAVGMQEEVERLREDAKRYRWLRSKHRLASTTSGRVEIRLPIFNGEAYLDLDAAIDAAREEE